MALTQAQRDAIKANLNLDTLDTYASNPDSLIEQMTPEQLLEGLKCGTLSLEQLNYLFFLGFTATEKALAESKAYTDGKLSENFTKNCNGERLTKDSFTPTCQEMMAAILAARQPAKIQEFTSGIVLSDCPNVGEAYVVQSLTLTNVKTIDVSGSLAASNKSTTNHVNFTVFFRVNNGVSAARYLGTILPATVLTNGYLQVPTSIDEEFYDLDPSLTYTIELCIAKQQPTGPLVVQDAFLKIRYSN